MVLLHEQHNVLDVLQRTRYPHWPLL
jgi:hypothetical protein